MATKTRHKLKHNATQHKLHGGIVQSLTSSAFVVKALQLKAAVPLSTVSVFNSSPIQVALQDLASNSGSCVQAQCACSTQITFEGIDYIDKGIGRAKFSQLCKLLYCRPSPCIQWPLQNSIIAWHSRSVPSGKAKAERERETVMSTECTQSDRN